MRFFCLSAVFVLCISNAICDTCERNGVRCLEYEVIKTEKDYEERRYPSIVWVSASDTAKQRSEVSKKLIKKLYAYLRGENDKKQRFDMVVPFRTTKQPLGAFNRYTMSIGLKPEQSANPPKPTDLSVIVTTEPETIYVSRSFDGQVRQESVWDEHARQLQLSTVEDKQVNSTFYYMSVYDSPWRETDRLNEVWMKKN